MHDLLRDRRLQPPLRPPLGLLPAPRRARVKGISGAHHGEVEGFLRTSRVPLTRDPGPPQVGAGNNVFLLLFPYLNNVIFSISVFG